MRSASTYEERVATSSLSQFLIDNQWLHTHQVRTSLDSTGFLGSKTYTFKVDFLSWLPLPNRLQTIVIQLEVFKIV